MPEFLVGITKNRGCTAVAFPISSDVPMLMLFYDFLEIFLDVSPAERWTLEFIKKNAGKLTSEFKRREESTARVVSWTFPSEAASKTGIGTPGTGKPMLHVGGMAIVTRSGEYRACSHL